MPETTPKKPAKKAVKTPVKAVKTRTARVATPIPLGRPVEYEDWMAEEVCWRIAQGEPLTRICRDDHLPHCATIYRWLIRFPDFCEMYTRAREDQADTNADEILSIADEMPPEYTDEKGRTMLDASFIQWQRSRIDARKWTSAKLKPRKYGDRVAVEGVEGGASIKTEETGSNRFLEILKNMEMTKRAG